MPKCGEYGTTGKRSGCITRKPPPLFEDGAARVEELRCPQGSSCPTVNEDGVKWVCTGSVDPLNPNEEGRKFPYIDEVECRKDGTPKQMGAYRGLRTRKREEAPGVSGVSKRPTWFQIMKQRLLNFFRMYKEAGSNYFNAWYNSVSSVVNDPYQWSMIKGLGLFFLGMFIIQIFSNFIRAETIRRAMERAEALVDIKEKK